jgi:hypothetical protein
MVCISILHKLIKIDFETLEAPYLQGSMFGATGAMSLRLGQPAPQERAGLKILAHQTF